MTQTNITKSANKAKLISIFKQPERRLLSAFMATMDLVPEFRAIFLAQAGYPSGRTCTYDSYMEPQFADPSAPGGRPDGVIYCTRGKTTWSALVEAKANEKEIIPEQIEGYLELAKYLGAQAVISISNQFSGQDGSLPFHIAHNKMRGRTVHHLSWTQIAAEGYLLLEAGPPLEKLEKAIIQELLGFFSKSESGVRSFDMMPKQWPDFVDQAASPIGFTRATAGATEIVHAWQQERRDLSIKLKNQTGGRMRAWFPLKTRKDKDARFKSDMTLLTKDYRLDANFIGGIPPVRLTVSADLNARTISCEGEFAPPDGKKAKACVSWLRDLLSESAAPKHTVLTIDWPGRSCASTMKVSDFLEWPERVAENQKEAPKKVYISTQKQDVRRFKSRKNFVVDLESEALEIVALFSRMGLL